MRKFWKHIVVAALGLVVLATFAGYYMALNSEPFAVATRAVSQSSEVRAIVGDLKDIDLAFFGYFVRYSGPGGEASFDMTVRGASKSLRVYADLDRKGGEWIVRQLRTENPTEN